MTFFHTFKTSLVGLKTHRLRSSLTILGVVIGITECRGKSCHRSRAEGSRRSGEKRRQGSHRSQNRSAGDCRAETWREDVCRRTGQGTGRRLRKLRAGRNLLPPEEG